MLLKPVTRRVLLAFAFGVPLLTVLLGQVHLAPPVQGAGALARWLYFGYWLYMTVGVPVFGVGCLVFMIGVLQFQSRSLEAAALMGQGRLEAASRVLTRRRIARWTGVGFYNLGLIELGLWRANEASLAFEQAWKYGPQKRLRALVAPQLALSRALIGDATGAERWLVEYGKLSPHESGQALLARSLVAARAGKPKAASELLERYEMNALSGPIRGLREAMRAWCEEALTGQARFVDRVALFGEAGPERLQALWPEIVAFAQRVPQR
jgi:hypothetical protein